VDAVGVTDQNRQSVLLVAEPGTGLSTALRQRAVACGDPVFVAPCIASTVPINAAALARAVGQALPPHADAAHEMIVAAVGDGVLVIDDAQLLDPLGRQIVERLVGRIRLVVGARPAAAADLAVLLGCDVEWLPPASIPSGDARSEAHRRRLLSCRLDELGAESVTWLASAAAVARVLAADGTISVDASLLDAPPDAMTRQRVVVPTSFGWSVPWADLAHEASARQSPAWVTAALTAAAARCSNAADASDLYAAGNDVAAAAKSALAALSTESSADRRALLEVRVAMAGEGGEQLHRAAGALVARELVEDARRLEVSHQLPADISLAIARQLDDEARRVSILEAAQATLPPATRRRESLLLRGLPADGDADAPPPQVEWVDEDLDAARLAWGFAVLAAAAAGDVQALRRHQAIASAKAGGRAAWATTGRQLGAIIDLHADGAAPADLDAGDERAAHPVLPSAVVVAHRVVGLVDAGRTGEALHLLEAAPLGTAPQMRALSKWVTAEVELAAGHPVRALRAVTADPAQPGLASIAGELDEPAHSPAETLAAVAAAWGAFESGEALPEFVSSPWPSMRGAALEFAALTSWREDDALSEVADRFLAAAVAWHPVHRRGDLRCRWAAGEALRVGGFLARAQDLLADVEREAQQLGMLPLLSRARQSLRRSGIRAKAASVASDRSGGAVGPLTAREHEVLLLTGKGLTAKGIAQQLGIGAATVETQIASAMVKLGAKSRLQAALMAKELTP
jgi:DNA-binding CsgD family transcriptional regulator